MSSQTTVESLKARIDEQAERLDSLANTDENKRIRKRILQNLGKLKKQLTTATSAEDNPDTQADNKPKETSNTSVPLSNKKAKLKLKIVNGEISEYALKKQLKLAKKRFDWLGRHGIKAGA